MNKNIKLTDTKCNIFSRQSICILLACYIRPVRWRCT